MKATLGLDFGSESVRALLLDVVAGRELATSEHAYASGIIRGRLPNTEIVLGGGWALQDPEDYTEALRCVMPRVLELAGASPADVIGIGIDFTSSTMLPTTADGTPLCSIPRFRARPHAWPKLWAHHAAQREADRLTEVATARELPHLDRFGGKISPESFLAKSLQILNEAPDVYAAADRLIEAADWIAWRLTGKEVRSAGPAGYKALWDRDEGFPSREFFTDVHPDFGGVVDEKLAREVAPVGSRAGRLSAAGASLTGLIAGTPVAVPSIDAHASVPGAAVTGPGSLVMVMGTSICHMTVDEAMRPFEGSFGIVRDGILPGFWGYEAGQPAFGDMFDWFAARLAPPLYHEKAARLGTDVHGTLAGDAATLAPGESGLLALDWWSGNRSILLDGDLSGLIVGLTQTTSPAAIYRALIEGAAFGSRTVVGELVDAGVAVDTIVACGGLPRRNPVIVAIFADVTGLPVDVAASGQAAALGAAMHGAVAAGSAASGYDSIIDAAAALAPSSTTRYEPDPAAKAVYDRLYAEYLMLHDHFGRGGNSVMKRLKEIQDEVTG